MAVQTEHALVLFQDEYGDERPDATMLDPGASAFLSGYGPFKRYVDHLNSMNYPVNTIRFARCERQFHFGGDASSQSGWTVDLPVMLDGKYGTIQCYLVPGNTPMLMGRPVIEALHMGIDFSQKQIRFGRSPWQPVLVGKHGEYLLSLTAGMEHVPDPTKSLFTLHIAEEVPGSHLHLEDFNNLEHVFAADEQVPTDNNFTSARLHRHALRTMEVQLTTTMNSTEAYITNELHQPPEHRRVYWEVYCGKARTGQIAEELGMKKLVGTLTNFFSDWTRKSLMKSFSLLNAKFGPACRPWRVEHRPSKKLWSLDGNIITADISALPSASTSDKQHMVDMLIWSNHGAPSAGTLKP